MKKIVLSIAVAASVAMLASCGGNTSEKAVEANESALATKIQNCTNPDSLKVYVEEAKAYAQKLVDEGKVDEAKKYLSQIEPVVKEKAPALSGVLSTVDGALDKIGESTSAAADSVKNAAAEAKDAAADKVSETKEAVADKTQELKDKASEKADELKQKAADATDEAAGKLKDLFK